MPKQGLVSSVGRASVCRTGGRGFKPRPDQHSGGLLIFRPNWSPKCCLCNDICKCLDFLVFLDKDEKPYVPSHSTFTDLFLWGVKDPTSLFEKSTGRRPRWCGQPLRVVWLGGDGTSHGTRLSPVQAHSLPIGLCPEKRVNQMFQQYFVFCLRSKRSKDTKSAFVEVGIYVCC